MNIDTFRLLYMCVAYFWYIFLMVCTKMNRDEHFFTMLFGSFFVLFCWICDGADNVIVKGNLFYCIYQYFFSGTVGIRFVWGIGALLPFYSCVYWLRIYVFGNVKKV